MLNPNAVKEFRLTVEKRHLRYLKTASIMPGDIAIVDLCGYPDKDQLTLVSFNERQWITKFSSKNPEYNYYPIIRIIMMS